MKIRQLDSKASASAASSPRLTQLSDAEIHGVAGGHCIYMETWHDGREMGWAHHNSYESDGGSGVSTISGQSSK